VEDRVSELKDEIDVKLKTDTFLVKQLKSCESNKQELSNFIKRPNLRIMGIEEGEDMQAEGICNISNKIVRENFPNIKNDVPISYRKPPGHETYFTKIETLHGVLSLKKKKSVTENTERILKTVREEKK
jgi:hypothetical protein